VEGRNLHIDYRWSTDEPEQMRGLAKELIGLKPELIIVQTTPAMTAIAQETKTIPIVFVNLVDPVDSGFISNMARPGGNVTGFHSFEFSLGGKWLGTLKQIAPAVNRVAILFNPERAPFAKTFVQVAGTAATSLGMGHSAAAVHNDIQLERTLAGFATTPGYGLIILPDIFTVRHRDLIIALAARYQLPAIYPLRRFTASGGLISYGADLHDIVRRSASYVDRILRG
jgi:putative ABC transport system substrate-binding protein